MSLQCFTYAYGIDIHSTICSLKLLGSSKRMCDSIVIRMASISLVSITIQCRLSVGNEESQVFAAVAENAALTGGIIKPFIRHFQCGFIVSSAASPESAQCVDYRGNLRLIIVFSLSICAAQQLPCTFFFGCTAEGNKLKIDCTIMFSKCLIDKGC